MRAAAYGIFILRNKAVDGSMTVVRRIETVAYGHIGCHLANLDSHAGTMTGIPHISPVAHLAVSGGPVGLPR